MKNDQFHNTLTVRNLPPVSMGSTTTSTSTIDREAKLFSASHAAAGGVYSHHKQNKKRACFLTFGKERRTMVRTLDLDESRR